MIMEKQWEATDRVTATKTQILIFLEMIMQVLPSNQIRHKFNYFAKHHVTNMYQNNE